MVFVFIRVEFEDLERVFSVFVFINFLIVFINLLIIFYKLSNHSRIISHVFEDDQYVQGT